MGGTFSTDPPTKAALEEMSRDSAIGRKEVIAMLDRLKDLYSLKISQKTFLACCADANLGSTSYRETLFNYFDDNTGHVYVQEFAVFAALTAGQTKQEMLSLAMKVVDLDANGLSLKELQRMFVMGVMATKRSNYDLPGMNGPDGNGMEDAPEFVLPRKEKRVIYDEAEQYFKSCSKTKQRISKGQLISSDKPDLMEDVLEYFLYISHALPESVDGNTRIPNDTPRPRSKRKSYTEREADRLAAEQAVKDDADRADELAQQQEEQRKLDERRAIKQAKKKKQTKKAAKQAEKERQEEERQEREDKEKDLLAKNSALEAQLKAEKKLAKEREEKDRILASAPKIVTVQRPDGKKQKGVVVAGKDGRDKVLLVENGQANGVANGVESDITEEASNTSSPLFKSVEDSDDFPRGSRKRSRKNLTNGSARPSLGSGRKASTKKGSIKRNSRKRLTDSYEYTYDTLSDDGKRSRKGSRKDSLRRRRRRRRSRKTPRSRGARSRSRGRRSSTGGRSSLLPRSMSRLDFGSDNEDADEMDDVLFPPRRRSVNAGPGPVPLGMRRSSLGRTGPVTPTGQSLRSSASPRADPVAIATYDNGYSPKKASPKKAKSRRKKDKKNKSKKKPQVILVQSGSDSSYTYTYTPEPAPVVVRMGGRHSDSYKGSPRIEPSPMQREDDLGAGPRGPSGPSPVLSRGSQQYSPYRSRAVRNYPSPTAPPRSILATSPRTPR